MQASVKLGIIWRQNFRYIKGEVITLKVLLLVHLIQILWAVKCHMGSLFILNSKEDRPELVQDIAILKDP